MPTQGLQTARWGPEIDISFSLIYLCKPTCRAPCVYAYSRFLFLSKQPSLTHFSPFFSPQFFFIFILMNEQLTAHVLGNKAEMDITQYIEQNPTLMRVGLFFEFNDARSRVATQLQKNIDRSKFDLHLFL